MLLEWVKSFGSGVLGIAVIFLLGWGIVAAFSPDTGNSDYGSVDSYGDAGGFDMSSYVVGVHEDANENYEEAERPDGTYTVEACSQNSGNCYDLDADISDGTVDTIYFPKGGYLDVDAELDDDGYGEGSSYNGDNWEINCYDCE